MADHANDKADSGAATPWRWASWPVAAMFACVAAVHLVWWLFGDFIVRYGNFADGDSYVRLVRVERLLETGGWFDTSLPRVNPPYGGSLHWTRLFDVLLIALAMPLEPLLGVKRALYWSGAVISPLLHLGAAAAVAWAAAPLIGRAAAVVAGALTAVQFGVLGYAIVGHADHHVLLGLVAVVAFGFSARALLAEGTGVRPALAAGAALAVGTWVGTEMQIPMALCMLGLGVPWVAGDAGAAERSLALALGLVGGLAATLLIERGPAAYFAVEYDRVSVVHLTQAALIAVFWSAVASLSRRGREPGSAVGRLIAALVGAALVAMAMRLLFPKILVDPLKDFDPAIVDLFAVIFEYQRIGDGGHFALYLGAAALALPWTLRRLVREWPDRRRWPWALLAASTLVYAAMALNWVRWSLYASLFSVVAVADLMAWLDARIDRRLAYPGRIAAKVAVMVLLAAGPLVAGTAWVQAAKPAPKAMFAAVDGDARPCPLQPLAKVLSAPPWGDRQHTVLTSADFGAELLYRTRHRVTATLHHRNAAGILASVRVFRGTDAARARALIASHQIDLVVVCRHAGRDTFFTDDAGDASFARRLVRGDAPPWLDEVTLPDGLKDRFRMFRVASRQ